MKIKTIKTESAFLIVPKIEIQYEILLEQGEVEVLNTEFFDGSYEDFKNQKTWQIALWISNDKKVLDLAKKSKNFSTFVVEAQRLGMKNDAGVSLFDKDLCISELDEHITQLEM